MCTTPPGGDYRLHTGHSTRAQYQTPLQVDVYEANQAFLSTSQEVCWSPEDSRVWQLGYPPFASGLDNRVLLPTWGCSRVPICRFYRSFRKPNVLFGSIWLFILKKSWPVRTDRSLCAMHRWNIFLIFGKKNYQLPGEKFPPLDLSRRQIFRYEPIHNQPVESGLPIMRFQAGHDFSSQMDNQPKHLNSTWTFHPWIQICFYDSDLFILKQPWLLF